MGCRRLNPSTTFVPKQQHQRKVRAKLPLWSQKGISRATRTAALDMRDRDPP